MAQPGDHWSSRRSRVFFAEHAESRPGRYGECLRLAGPDGTGCFARSPNVAVPRAVRGIGSCEYECVAHPPRVPATVSPITNEQDG